MEWNPEGRPCSKTSCEKQGWQVCNGVPENGVHFRKLGSQQGRVSYYPSSNRADDSCRCASESETHWGFSYCSLMEMPCRSVAAVSHSVTMLVLCYCNKTPEARYFLEKGGAFSSWFWRCRSLVLASVWPGDHLLDISQQARRPCGWEWGMTGGRGPTLREASLEPWVAMDERPEAAAALLPVWARGAQW